MIRLIDFHGRINHLDQGPTTENAVVDRKDSARRKAAAVSCSVHPSKSIVEHDPHGVCHERCCWDDTFDTDGDPNNQWWAGAYSPGEDGLNRTIAEICWTGGGYSITEDDSAVVDCLMDLHVNQQTTCIDTVGSSCDVHPGTGVGNVKNSYSLSGKGDQQIDAYNADRSKEAFRQMINREHGFDINTYTFIRCMTMGPIHPGLFRY